MTATHTICQCKYDHLEQNVDQNIDGVLQILDLHFLWGTLAVNAKQTRCSYSESCFCSVPGSRTLPHCCTALKVFFFFSFFTLFIFLRRRDESDNLLLSHFPTAAVCRATRTASECEMRGSDGLLACQSAQQRISPNDGQDSLRTKKLHQTWKTTQRQAKYSISIPLWYLGKCGNMLPHSLHRSIFVNICVFGQQKKCFSALHFQVAVAVFVSLQHEQPKPSWRFPSLIPMHQFNVGYVLSNAAPTVGGLGKLLKLLFCISISQKLSCRASWGEHLSACT